MRTAYYTPDTIDTQACSFIDDLKELRAKHKRLTQPLLHSSAALLVIDMQGFFLNPASHAFIPSAPAIAPKIKQLQEHFLQHAQHTQHARHTRHTHHSLRPNYGHGDENCDHHIIQTRHSNDQRNAGQMAAWWGDNHLLSEHDPNAAIIAELQHPQIPIIDKAQYDAFWHTDLEERLRTRNVTQLVITGVMAHLCCETTARTAFTRGFEVLFVVDATATYDAEFHYATLRNLAHGFAVPVLADEIKQKNDTAIFV